MASGTKTSSDKIKKTALAVLGLGLAIVLIKQLFFSSPPARPRIQSRQTQAAQTTAASTSGGSTQSTDTTSNKPTRAGDREAQLQQMLADSSPLNFALLTSAPKASEISRNIFDFKLPPPPPPIKQPDPPPITIQYLQPQSAIAGTPREFTVIVFGKSFPPDAQIFMGGSAKATKRVNDSQLSTVITPAEYASPRTIPVEVKSQSDQTKLYSNQIPLMIQQSPLPPFKFVGRIGDIGVFELLGAGGQKEYLRLRRGDTIQNAWKIDNITDSGVDVTDTRYDIKKRITLEERRMPQ